MKIMNALLLAAALILLVNCSSATRTTAENANANSPNNFNAAAAVAIEPTPAADNQAAKLAPGALIRDLYRQHDVQKSPFFQIKDRALVDKYFVKNLADSIWKDAKESNDEVGALDFDPLYNAQDVEIKNLSINQPKISGDRAEVAVTFENYREKQTLVYTTVKQMGDWKISDINYGGGTTLVGIFKDSATAPVETANASGEFAGKYQIGETSCTVTPIKMAFEVRWEKGSGVEMFFADERGGSSDKITFSSSNPSGKGTPNVFSFDDEKYTAGTFYRADGEEFPIKRIK